MARLIILWTATAVKQRNHIFEYWNERNKSMVFSRKLNEKIKERIELLKTNPKLGKRTGYNTTRAISYRQYSIFYERVDSNIIIKGIWDNRQDPHKLIDFLTK